MIPQRWIEGYLRFLLRYRVVVALACDSSRQIEHMEFDRGMTQQVGEVPEPFRVL